MKVKVVLAVGVKRRNQKQTESSSVPSVLIALDEQSVGGGAARGVARRGQVAGSRTKLSGESLSCQPLEKTAQKTKVAYGTENLLCP